MRIYLDNCSLQRPLDSKTQIKIALEIEAILGVLALWELGKISLVSSEVLEFEASKMANSTRKELTFEILNKMSEFIRLNEKIIKEAEKFVKKNIKSLDALHLAVAEFSQVDFFCTCDLKLLKNAKKISTLKIKVVSPIELIEELEK